MGPEEKRKLRIEIEICTIKFKLEGKKIKVQKPGRAYGTKAVYRYDYLLLGNEPLPFFNKPPLKKESK